MLSIIKKQSTTFSNSPTQASFANATQTLSLEAQNTKPNAHLSIGEVIDGKYEVVKEFYQNSKEGLFLTSHFTTKQTFLVKAVYKDSPDFNAATIMQEFQRFRSLTYQGIPAAIDIVDRAQMFLIVFQHNEGDFLQDIISRGDLLSEAEIIDYAIQLCSILEYLHTAAPATSFHAINPRNIIICPGKQLVFLAFLCQRQKNDDVEKDKNSLGALFYTAPEVLSASQATDIRTDIFSFGATFYSLITRSDPALPPHAVYPLRDRRPELSKGFEYIINKCMEAEPDKRYQNIDALLRDLKSVDKITGKLSRQDKIHSFFRRNK